MVWWTRRDENDGEGDKRSRERGQWWAVQAPQDMWEVGVVLMTDESEGRCGGGAGRGKGGPSRVGAPEVGLALLMEGDLHIRWIVIRQ